jgi:hypothetical protein
MISKRVQVATAWEPGLGTGFDLNVACSGRGGISWNRAETLALYYEPPPPFLLQICTNPRTEFSASKVGNPLFSGNVSSLHTSDSCYQLNDTQKKRNIFGRPIKHQFTIKSRKKTYR